MFLRRFAIVSDEVMDYFSKFATEDQARVKLDENRVAQGTALWREECLPMETVLFGVVGAEGRKSSLFPEAKDVLAKIPAKCTLQIGGKASTGKGMVDCILVSPQQ